MNGVQDFIQISYCNVKKDDKPIFQQKICINQVYLYVQSREFNFNIRPDQPKYSNSNYKESK